MEKSEYKICSRCIMDISDSEIVLNEEGICNHCLRYDELLHNRVQLEDGEKSLNQIVTRIKAKRRSAQDYDCIIGVSGGVDSTYVAYLCKKLGLNPLAIHFDNGWNSELAVRNIEDCLNILGIDLVTEVIRWKHFKEMQKAFLFASVPDGEVPTDHAINALLFREANKRGIKYIINGMNFQTESLSVRTWAYGHSDWKYIQSVTKKFSNIKDFSFYPHFSLLDLIKYVTIKQIKVVSILNYIDYKKDEVIKILENELNWRNYGGKHYESIYTRFYQGFLLPNKFKIDKRRGHLSDLIRSHQMTRERALVEISKPAYIDSNLEQEDIVFVKKKLELTDNEFEKILSSKNKTYRVFRNNEYKISMLKKALNFLRKQKLYSK